MWIFRRKHAGGRSKKLIKAGGKATLLHQIFQHTGIPPDEFRRKPAGVRAFMYASMIIRLETDQNGGDYDRSDN